MVQPLIAFSLETPDALYAFVKGLRNAGVMRLKSDTLEIDLVPGGESQDIFGPDVEQKKQKILDAFKTAQELTTEAQQDLEWSMP